MTHLIALYRCNATLQRGGAPDNSPVASLKSPEGAQRIPGIKPRIALRFIRATLAAQTVYFRHQQRALAIRKIDREKECAACGQASSIARHEATLSCAFVRVGTLRFAHPTLAIQTLSRSGNG